MPIIKTQLDYAEFDNANKILANKMAEIHGANLLIRTDKNGYPIGENITETPVIDSDEFKVVVFQEDKFKIIDSDLVGNRGAKGPQGDKGTQGDKGVQGDKGTQGDHGPQGLPGGPEGYKGPQGDKGIEGDKGPQGDKGEPGERGAQGFLGPQGLPGGPEGYRGPQGDKGDQGDKGEKGETGERGPQGFIGENGAQGYAGAQGLPGKDGIDGKNGETGDKGLQGDKGTEGDKGPQGNKGPDGDKGPQGSRGPQGFPGGAQGDRGPQGFPGIPKIVYKLSPTTTTIRNLVFDNKVFYQNAIIGTGENGSVSIDITKKICFSDCIFNSSDTLIDFENDLVSGLISEIIFDRCQFNGTKANGSIIKFSNTSTLKSLSFINNTFESNSQDNNNRFIISGLGRGASIDRLVFNDNDLSEFGTGQKFEIPQLFHPSVKSYIVRNNRGFDTRIRRKVVINAGSTNTGFIMLTINELPFGFADNNDVSLSTLNIIPVSSPGNFTTGNGWYVTRHTNWPTETTPSKFMINSVVAPTTSWSFIVEVNCEIKS